MLVASRGGHPPAVILLPAVLPVWGVGHFLLWWVPRVHRRALVRRPSAGPHRPPWPVLTTLIGSGLFAFVVFWGMLFSWVLADRREGWLGSSWLWVTIFLPWLAHAVCFAALLCRHPSSRLAGAGLWAGWGVLLV